MSQKVYNFIVLIWVMIFKCCCLSISFFNRLDPLANGLRRRAQSLNFAIRSSQSSIDNTRQNTSSLPVAKRRRKEPVNILSSSSKLSTSQIIRTRKKSSSILINQDLLSMPKKDTKTTRRRRRTDPFVRM